LKQVKNLGYAGGNNVGIDFALKQGADLVLLLNNDTLVDNNFIAALLKSTKTSNIGIFGAYPIRMTDPEKIDHLGGRWNTTSATFDLIGLGAAKDLKPSSLLIMSADAPF